MGNELNSKGISSVCERETKHLNTTEQSNDTRQLTILVKREIHEYTKNSLYVVRQGRFTGTSSDTQKDSHKNPNDPSHRLLQVCRRDRYCNLADSYFIGPVIDIL